MSKLLIKPLINKKKQSFLKFLLNYVNLIIEETIVWNSKVEFAKNIIARNWLTAEDCGQYFTNKYTENLIFKLQCYSFNYILLN